MNHRIAIACIAATFAAAAHAAPTVNGFDLATFDFDVTSYNVGSNPQGIGGDANASGTSDGIAWSISPTSLWSARTTTNGSFQFAALPNTTDNLHPSGDYTITFAQPVATLIVALSNNDTTDSINFGMVPSYMQGVHAVGTQIVLDNIAGGLAWFTNVDSLTITNVNNNGIDDGYDLAFHAIPAVPEPASWALALAGLGVIGAALRARRF